MTHRSASPGPGSREATCRTNMLWKRLRRLSIYDPSRRPMPPLLARQRSEQTFTLSHSRFHFLRQKKGRPHVWQILCGRLALSGFKPLAFFRAIRNQTLFGRASPLVWVGQGAQSKEGLIYGCHAFAGCRAPFQRRPPLPGQRKQIAGPGGRLSHGPQA